MRIRLIGDLARDGRRVPSLTVRARLTALYGGLFLITGTLLLVITYVLQKRSVDQRTQRYSLNGAGTGQTGHRRAAAEAAGQATAQMRHTMEAIRAETLHQLLLDSAISVAVLAVVGLAVGYWLAGRVLRPVQHIAATARRLSGANLHERIQLEGPADEFTSLAATFDDMLDRLERSFADQRAFIANVSHELRNPLAAQRAAIQIGLARTTPESLTRVRTELLDANRRTETLIDGLLTLARSDSGLDHREPVELDVRARTAMDALRDFAAEAGVRIEVTTRPVVVNGDPVLLAQLVTNLVHNAVRYNHRGGRVEVTVTPEDGVRVANTGPVVPADRVAGLFQPFHRLDGSRLGTDGGAGLGLSIVRSIARAHGSTVTATARPAGGLDVRVPLPVVDHAPTGTLDSADR